MENSSELPYRQNLLSDPSFSGLLTKNPYLTLFARQLSNVRPVANSPYFNKILAAVSHNMIDVIYGRKSPQQGVQDAYTEAAGLAAGR